VPAPQTSPSGLTAENLRRTYHIGPREIEVLRGVSFSVAQGERVFLCGPSGAGKTTLLYVLGGLEAPDGGRVLLHGESLYDRPDADLARLRNRLTGYVFQNYLLLPELTALENVCLPAMIGGREARETAASLLGKVGLGHRLHHLPAELSGGEQQRVAIARALVNNPTYLFADEPTGNLDSRTGAEVMNLLLSLVADSGKTLMVVTHDTRLASHGDRTLVLRDGLLESS
jgi:putative ABC transport system ATP-binding protein/lipoprotein-releasing system ATP-binding protein